MNKRIAEKIIKRFNSGSFYRTIYNLEQVVRAHQVAGVALPEDIRKEWQEKSAATPAPTEMVVQVGAVEVKVEAGDDGVLGTEDDKKTIQKAGTELSKLSVSELKEKAKAAGLSGYSKLKKDELVDMLLKAE